MHAIIPLAMVRNMEDACERPLQCFNLELDVCCDYHLEIVEVLACQVVYVY